ncbi:hypothetical protein [Cellulosimicrobium sp. NPDC057862]|uniref:hypothetical protein n=1 Tax=Cellulosimicrobium sp. NPDC057862 TaxID=3346266 RepID=UPI00366E9046
MTDGHDLDLLLWFRDALGLVVPGDDVPPRAVPRSPDRSGLLGDDERVAAVGPGVVVCSTSAYGDDAAFTAEVVRAAFESALRA